MKYNYLNKEINGIDIYYFNRAKHQPSDIILCFYYKSDGRPYLRSGVNLFYYKI